MTEQHVELTKVNDFLLEEIALFTDLQCSFSLTRRLMPDLRLKQYAQVKEKTKKGLILGIDDFLEQTGNRHIYTSDLSQFCLNNPAERYIEEQVNSLNYDLNKNNIRKYANVNNSLFGIFMYNFGVERLLNRFEASEIVVN